jgi:hypothetical protein
MMMALVVLIGLSLLFLSAFDERMLGADQSIESIIARQAKEIDGIKGALTRGKMKLGLGHDLVAAENELTGIKKENQLREGLLGRLRLEITETNAAIASIAKDFEAYKDEYRGLVRGKAKGQTMERLEIRDGTVYDNITIREVTAIGVQFRHDGGFKRIAFEDLPAAMQDHFQFDSKQKAAAVAKEEATRNEHEAAVSVIYEATDRQLAEKRKKDAVVMKEKAIRAIAMKESRVKTLGSEIQSLQEAIRKERYKPLSRAPQMRDQLADKQSALAELQAEVSRLKNGL